MYAKCVNWNMFEYRTAAIGEFCSFCVVHSLYSGKIKLSVSERVRECLAIVYVTNITNNSNEPKIGGASIVDIQTMMLLFVYWSWKCAAWIQCVLMIKIFVRKCDVISHFVECHLAHTHTHSKQYKLNHSALSNPMWIERF